jgi:antitoxin HicB
MSQLTTSKKPLDHYLSLKYPMEISEDDGGWFVSVPDLPGCDSFGTTVEDAIKNVQEAKELWMRSQSDSGGEIPEPTDEDDFSGKFVLRIPRTLHRSLAYQAQKQGVSLNHYASSLLAERNPLQILQRTMERRFALWSDPQNVWVHQHDTPRRQYILAGAKYKNDLSALIILSKPAFKGAMRVPQTVEEQYQIDYTHGK